MVVCLIIVLSCPQTRCKIVEVYNKQSLITVQQHISTINSQVTKHRFVTTFSFFSHEFLVFRPVFSALLRTQKMEHVRKVLLEEIHKLEQDETVLKNMENDLTVGYSVCSQTV